MITSQRQGRLLSSQSIRETKEITLMDASKAIPSKRRNEMRHGERGAVMIQEVLLCVIMVLFTVGAGAFIGLRINTVYVGDPSASTAEECDPRVGCDGSLLAAFSSFQRGGGSTGTNPVKTWRPNP